MEGSRAVQIITDLDPGGPQTYGSYGSGSRDTAKNITLKRSVLPGKEHEIPHVLLEVPHTLPSHFHNLCLVRNREKAVQRPKLFKKND
jgi:hypothetical protein